MTKQEALGMVWDASRAIMAHYPYPLQLSDEDNAACAILFEAEKALRIEARKELSK